MQELESPTSCKFADAIKPNKKINNQVVINTEILATRTEREITVAVVVRESMRRLFHHDLCLENELGKH